MFHDLPATSKLLIIVDLQDQLVDLRLRSSQEGKVRVVLVGVFDESLQQQPVPRKPLEGLGQQASNTEPLNTRFYFTDSVV